MTRPPTEHPLDIEVLKQFRVIFKSVRSHFQSIERACGLSGAQLWALAKISDLPNIALNQLAQELAIHQTTASNLVEKLASKGLVDKVRQKADQRFVALALTAAGRQLLAAAPGPFEGILPDALGKMPHQKLLSLHRLLADLQTLMDPVDEDAGRSPLSEI